MTSSFNKKLNGLSPVERLKVTDKYLSELRGILIQMDEIAAFRTKNGGASADEVGGYKRSSVMNMIEELEKQKESILAEIAADEKAKKQSAVPAKQEKGEVAAKPQGQIAEKKGAVAEFMRGDNSLALESMYSGLSMDIEKMRDDILQEMKYTYKQDMAIYDDLSEKIESIKQMDFASLEEKLRPLQALVALSEKLDALQPLDYDELAGKVAEKMVQKDIDYDLLAGKVAALVAGGAVAASGAQIAAVENKIDDVQKTLSGAVSVKQLPEFKKLDALISEYLRTLSYDLIPDILLTADSVKRLSDRYIVSGNNLRGETMLSDLRMRLERVNVWGTSAITAVSDAIAAHNLPVTYAKDALEAFKREVFAFEQSPALPPDELAQRLMRTKQALFCDADMEAMDKDTLEEILEIRQEVGDGVPDAGKVANLTELKKELMSFNLSYFVELTPVLPQEKENAPASSVDTQVILEAIARLGMTIPAAVQQPQQEAPEIKPEELRAKMEELAASRPAGPAKKKVLRPAVSSKDNKVDKTEQPLRIVKRSIKTSNDNPEALSKTIVEQLAVRIANSRVK